MKLIHIEHTTEQTKLRNPVSMHISFSSGVAMSQFIRRVNNFCIAQQKDTIVEWQSNHHEIVLWVENEKYKTFLLLSLPDTSE